MKNESVRKLLWLKIISISLSCVSPAHCAQGSRVAPSRCEALFASVGRYNSIAELSSPLRHLIALGKSEPIDTNRFQFSYPSNQNNVSRGEHWAYIEDPLRFQGFRSTPYGLSIEAVFREGHEYSGGHFYALEGRRLDYPEGLGWIRRSESFEGYPAREVRAITADGRSQKIMTTRVLLADAINQKHGLRIGHTSIAFLGMNGEATQQDYMRLISKGIVAINQSSTRTLGHDMFVHVPGYWVLSHHELWSEIKGVLTTTFEKYDSLKNESEKAKFYSKTIKLLADNLENVTNSFNYTAYRYRPNDIDLFNAGVISDLSENLKIVKQGLSENKF